ncbi:diguanylate cyclase [Breoghania sp. L-A4]|uniref:GGDEF domain-containing response regulator n=1 Tax=Breoghania sp. L-A4 TaxID=2304600 RepID=UPI000E360383|nr:diguanylate cyclase [Breoghania sp. L-A4]AXS39309.1 diguanylate cyclase [Breoghania sp. L-A4]
METILLVEDTSFFEKAVTRLFRKTDGFKLIVAKTYREAQRILEDGGNEIFVALVDLTLPDTNDIEIVDLTVSSRIPTIVFSSRYDEGLRTRILEKGVVDYVLKDSPASLGYLKALVHRLRKNRSVSTLVVDDSTTQLRMIAERLKRLQLTVHTASCGTDALAVLKRDPAIRLVVLDYIMPNMDGIQLLKEIRHLRGTDGLAVMGLSSCQNPTSMARFLKFGANDFLSKSCSPEEFMLRVGQNLDTIDRISELTDAANRDAMTGLRNRRFLFDAGRKVFDVCRKNGRPATVTLIDIDCFKQINDRFGHEAGDSIIKLLADDLREAGPADVIAVRQGGDEFCLLMPDCSQVEAIERCQRLHDRFARRKLDYRSAEVPISLSIGVASGVEADLDEAIRVADAHLYDAKNQGRNRLAAADYSRTLTIGTAAAASAALPA